MNETDVLYKNRDIEKNYYPNELWKYSKQTYFFLITGVNNLIWNKKIWDKDEVTWDVTCNKTINVILIIWVTCTKVVWCHVCNTQN